MKRLLVRFSAVKSGSLKIASHGNGSPSSSSVFSWSGFGPVRPRGAISVLEPTRGVRSASFWVLMAAGHYRLIFGVSRSGSHREVRLSWARSMLLFAPLILRFLAVSLLCLVWLGGSG